MTRRARGRARLRFVPRSRVIAVVFLSASLAAAPVFAKRPVPKPRPAPALAAPEPAGPTAQSMTGDMERAVPATEAGQLPSTRQQYESLQQQVEQAKPQVEDARRKSDALATQTARLRQKLIATAARVQSLETQKLALDGEIAGLGAREKTLSQNLDRDRAGVSRLIAVLERLQGDMPPVLAIKADDALDSAHAAMLLGASLPRVYGAAAALARRLEALRTTRTALIARRADAARNAAALHLARYELDQLVAMKEQEAGEAAQTFGVLNSRLNVIAGQAKDLKSLLAKVAALRAEPEGADVVVVSAGNQAALSKSKAGSLRKPVVGRLIEGGPDGVGGASAPGVSYVTEAGAAVVAPADGEVLFAGPYHKAGLVLILETADGYDLVLAGLGSAGVRPGDRLLEGEPLGTMPRNGPNPRLYFELRRDGEGQSPLPLLGADLRKAKRT